MGEFAIGDVFAFWDFCLIPVGKAGKTNTIFTVILG